MDLIGKVGQYCALLTITAGVNFLKHPQKNHPLNRLAQRVALTL
jgi:hypothetical protein